MLGIQFTHKKKIYGQNVQTDDGKSKISSINPNNQEKCVCSWNERVTWDHSEKKRQSLSPSSSRFIDSLKLHFYVLELQLHSPSDLKTEYKQMIVFFIIISFRVV